MLTGYVIVYTLNTRHNERELSMPKWIDMTLSYIRLDNDERKRNLIYGALCGLGGRDL